MLCVASHMFLAILLVCIGQPQTAASAEAPYLFYHPLPYGSMSMFTPWNVVINGSYDVLQLDGRDRRILELPYGKGLRNVWDNCIVHPITTIEQIGWWKFLKTEILPLTLSKEGGQWVPNYQLHLIGGGVTYRMLEEWYSHNGVSAPSAWAAGTIAMYHILNEAVEAQDYKGYNTDPVADLLLFDWLGVLLFSNDDIARFFAHTLHMSDWSHLPVITFPHLQLGNNGLYYSMKWMLPEQDRWSIFYLFGMSNMIGATCSIDGENSVSLGAGARGRNLYVVDPRARVLSTNLVPTGGIFWDKNNSLMASLTISGQHDQTVILNIYPGVFSVAGVSAAVWSSWGSSGSFGAGFALRGTVGVGYRNEPQRVNLQRSDP